MTFLAERDAFEREIDSHYSAYPTALAAVDAELREIPTRHRERHGDLVVRVSGYSSYFTRPAEAIQDEIIEREVVTR